MENKQTPMEMTPKTTHSCDMKSRLISVMHSAQRLFALLCGIFMLTAAVAQVPQAFHYQMVVRDANDYLVRNTTVGLQLTIYTIHNGQSTNRYQERQTVTTDGNGLLSVMVGQGTVQEGVFVDIPWGDYDSVFLRAQADPAGGTNYTLSAVQQLVAVPYAFLANETQGLGDVSARGNSAGNHQLKSVKDPTDPQDVITKYYLDSVLADFVKHMYSESRDTAACITPGSTLHWRGRELATAGTYRHNVPGGAADTVVILTLTVSNGTHNAFEASACNTYTWHETSYTTAGAHTYAYTDDNGCPSVDTLHLSLITGLTGDTTAEKCETFTWYGFPYTASATPTHTFTSSQGCDSVVTLHLTINHAASTDTIATACETFTWYGETLTASTNTPTHTFKTIHDCDSTVTLNLTINQPSAGIDTRTVCDSLKWIDNQWYKSSTTTATHIIPNAKGCDSTVTLHLTINSSKTTNDALTICATALPYEWNGETFTAAGSQSATLKTTKDCDSTVSMTLTVNDKYEVDDAKSICSDELPYTWNGKTFNAAGSQSADLTAVNGCDSTVNMTLTVNFTASTDTIAVACETFTWYGETLTASTATPTHTFKTIHDCDSTVTLNLTINQPTAGTDTRTACDTYTWIDGNDYTASTTTATHTIPNDKGCDSTVTLHLTINYKTTGIDIQNITGDSYEWIDGNTYTEDNNTATYTITNGNAKGCDSVVTLNLTFSTETVTYGIDEITACDSLVWKDGITYKSSTTTPTHTLTGANQYGLDSIVTLHLTLRHSSTSTDLQAACDSLQWHGKWYKVSTSTIHDTILAGNAKGCDSVVTLNLTLNFSVARDTFVIRTSVLSWRGNIYDATGDYPVTFHTAAGCDSIITLHLSIVDYLRGDTTAVECDHFTWYGTTYNESTTASHTLTGAGTGGLDSIVMLNLTIKHSTSGSETQSVCGSYTWHGNTYNATGDYPVTLTNADNCDSVATLHLTIRAATSATDTRTACDSLLWTDGTWYKASTTTPTQTLTNKAGCDSVVTLHLTINHSNASTETLSECGSYTWPANGETYTSNATATYVGTTAEGCPDVRTLTLTINPTSTVIDKQRACDSYTWLANGQTYTSTNATAATVTLTNAAGCDSTVTLDLTINASTTESSTENVCGSTTTWSGKTYDVSPSGSTYSQESINANGCPHTITKTFYNRITTENWIDHDYNSKSLIIQHDTVCAGTTSYTYWDTLLFNTFPGSHVYGTSNSATDKWIRRKYSSSDDWGVRAYMQGGKNRYTYYYDHTSGDGSSGYMNVRALDGSQKDSYVWTPAFSFSDPANTEISFWYIKPQYSTSYADYFEARVCEASDPTVSIHYNFEGYYLVCNYTGYAVNSWVRYNATCSSLVYYTNSTSSSELLGSLPAGTWRLKFFFADFNGTGAGIDDILIRERKTVNLSSYSAGSTWYETSPTTNSYGCPHYTGRTVYIRPSGTTYTEEACDSYTWNGSTYTTSNTYTKNRTLSTTISGGSTVTPSQTTCSVTDRLNLTIVNDASTAYNQTANNNFTWSANGSYGHGTGFNYEYSGNYIGPNYNAPCQSRDTLHLTVNRNVCAGGKYYVSVCEPLTWLASGNYGKGDGATHNASGTFYGPAYTPAGCATTFHDTLVLTVGSPSSAKYAVTACDSYTWLASGGDKGHGTGQSYSAEGTATIIGLTYNSPSDCPSTDTLLLTLGKTVNTSVTQTACDSYTWIVSGQTYTSSGTYTYPTGGLCPGTNTLSLTIRPAKHTYVEKTICEGQTTYGVGDRIIYSNDFETVSDVSDWSFSTAFVGYEGKNWMRSSAQSHDGNYSLYCPIIGNYDYIDGSSYATTPAIYIEDPVNTEFTFYVKLPNVYHDFNNRYSPNDLELYIKTPSQAIGAGIPLIYSSNGTYASNWTRQGGYLPDGLEPGYYQIVFRSYDQWSYTAIDEFVLEQKNAPIPIPSDLTLGDNESTETFTAVNGCDSIVHTIWHVVGTSDRSESHQVCPDAYPVTFCGATFASAGSQTVTQTANEGACSSKVTVTVTNKLDAAIGTIVNGSDEPLETLNQSVTLGSPISTYKLFETSNVSTINVVGLPTGVTYNSSTRTISGTPTALGTYTFSIIATAANGCAPATRTGTITVTP